MDNDFDSYFDQVPPERRQEYAQRVLQAMGEIASDIQGESAQAEKALKPDTNPQQFEHAARRLAWLQSLGSRITAEEEAERKALKKFLLDRVKRYQHVDSKDWR